MSAEFSEAEYDRIVHSAILNAERTPNLDELPPPVRVVAVVATAQGVIDNGGLQYFFEADFPNRPPYSLFIDAYRAIGALAEAQAIADAADLFPFDEPHLHQPRRDEYLEQFLEGGSHRRDSPFESHRKALSLEGSKRVWRLLKKYVEQQHGAFPK